MATDIGHEILVDLLTDYPGWRGVLGEFGIDGRGGTGITRRRQPNGQASIWRR